jgi:hypothetical protein
MKTPNTTRPRSKGRRLVGDAESVRPGVSPRSAGDRYGWEDQEIRRAIRRSLEDSPDLPECRTLAILWNMWSRLPGSATAADGVVVDLRAAIRTRVQRHISETGCVFCTLSLALLPGGTAVPEEVRTWCDLFDGLLEFRRRRMTEDTAAWKSASPGTRPPGPPGLPSIPDWAVYYDPAIPGAHSQATELSDRAGESLCKVCSPVDSTRIRAVLLLAGVLGHEIRAPGILVFREGTTLVIQADAALATADWLERRVALVDAAIRVANGEDSRDAGRSGVDVFPVPDLECGGLPPL